MRYVALIVLLFVVVACSSSAPPITAHGTLTVETGLLSGTNVTDAYPDITSGSQVVVTDPSGAVIGTGTLSYDKTQTFVEEVSATAAAAKAMDTSTAVIADSVSQDLAVYDFTVTGLPGGDTRYGIKAGQNRGTIWFTPAQMQSGPALTLGSLSS